VKRIYASDIDEVDLLSSTAGNDRPKRVLYAGDDDIDRAALYLAAALHHEGWEIDYLCSGEMPPEALRTPEGLSRYDLILFSDYPVGPAHLQFLEAVVAAHHRGVPFLMVGGWESFAGSAGWYADTPVQAILPVVLAQEDDRINTWQGIVVQPASQDAGPFTSLDWSTPPVIAGCNRLIPSRNAEILLVGRVLKLGAGGVPSPEGAGQVGGETTLPLLLRRDRSFALAFDLAPHWIAGMVDWGVQRMELTIGRAEHVEGSSRMGAYPRAGELTAEVGSSYLEFIGALIALAAGIS
jgi:hypothetical protein